MIQEQTRQLVIEPWGSCGVFWKVHCKKNLSPIRDSPDPTPFSDWWEHIFFSLVLASFLLGGLLWRLQTNVSLAQVSSPHRLRPSQRNRTPEATLGRGIEPRVWGWRGDLVSLLFYGCWNELHLVPNNRHYFTVVEVRNPKWVSW